MLYKLRSGMSYANVVSTACLFVVLGGGAYAASTLPPNSVGAKQLRANAVRNPAIKDGAVTSPKVKDASLLAKDFASGQLPAGPTGPAGPKGPAGASNPNADTLGGIGPQGFIQGAGRAFVAHDSANLSGVVPPAQNLTPLGSVAGLGSFAVGGANAATGNDCRVTFTNTSGGPLALGASANPGLADGATIELAGVDARPAGANAVVTIATPSATHVLTGLVTVTFGFPAAQNVGCAGAVHALVN
jgi:hypothetical protein